MNEKVKVLRAKYLSTDIPKWRVVASTVFLLIACVSPVVIFWYMVQTNLQFQCVKGFTYASVLWLFSQLVVIGYLYYFRSIPNFARQAITILLLTSNMWFILFIVSLKPCAV